MFVKNPLRSAVESSLLISFPLPKPEGSDIGFASTPELAINIHSILADGVPLIASPTRRGAGGGAPRITGASLKVYTFMADKEPIQGQNQARGTGQQTTEADAIEQFYYLYSFARGSTGVGLLRVPLDVKTLEITYSGSFNKFADENISTYTTYNGDAVYTLIAKRSDM